MKYILLIFSLMSAPAFADREWRTADTVREGLWLAVHIADTGTTLDGVGNGYHEKNPIIGTHPTRERVVVMMTAGAITHAGISYALPHGWRDAWQYVTILESGYCVERNLSIGLRVKF